MATYAGTKGKPIPLPASPLKGEGRVLSELEKDAIAGRVRLVKAHMPEAFEFLKALHAEGLVDGLRGLVSVTVFEGVDHGIG